MVLTGPIVMKFGGTSVADAEAIARVVGIVKGARESSGLPPVVIVSAMSGVTDRLLELTEAAGRRRDAHVLNGVADLSRRHFEAVERLLPPEFANRRARRNRRRSSTISARCSRPPGSCAPPRRARTTPLSAPAS